MSSNAVKPASGATEPVRDSARLATVAWGCVRLLRIPHWIKNGFILAPLVFSGELTNWPSAKAALWACLSFGFLTSAVYVMNDWLDREEDRRHPVKQSRPIASGVVPGAVAAVLAPVLLALAAGVGYLTTNIAVVELMLAYFVLNVLYSLYLKHIVLLDVFTISAGFVIRVVVGAEAIQVMASHWLLLCTLLLALFLGFTKRRSELLCLEKDSSNHRPVLVYYTPELIKQLNLILCSATVVCYAIYTVAPETVERFGTDRLLYTAPFVLYGLFRYLFISESGGEVDNPSSLIFRDLSLGACIFAWLAACIMIVYL